MGTTKATPGFVGERLAEAREARGYNRAQLAEALGITRQAVSQYEKNRRSPTAQILEDAARFLRFPLHRFTAPLGDSPDGALFFRSLASATQSARGRAARRLAWVESICAYLRTWVEFPAVNLPSIDVPADPVALDFDDIEDIARQTRRHWNLGDGPIADMVMLLENNGVIVVRQELGAQNLDAFSRWNSVDSTPYVVLGTDKETAVRSRINAAHELGHMILHRNVRPSNFARRDLHSFIEDQAFYFAGAFLLPPDTFRAELARASIQTFVTLKPRWRVSIAAMILRAKHLGIISDSEAERLFVYRAQRGWTRKEPLDFELEPEEPCFIERAFDLLLNEGIATRQSIEASLAMFAADIESATGLPPGFFDDDVKHFKFPRLNQPDHPPSDGGGDGLRLSSLA